MSSVLTRKVAKQLLKAQEFENKFSLRNVGNPFGPEDHYELMIKDFDPETQKQFDASVLPKRVHIMYKTLPGWSMFTTSGPGHPTRFGFKKAW